MKKQLNEEQKKNQKLNDDITKYKNTIDNLNNEITNLKPYKEKNKLLEEAIKKNNKNSLEQENKELKEKLNKANKIIEKQIIEIGELKNQINSIKNIDNNQINNLKNDIINKNNEINQLKQQLQNINLNNNGNEIQINKKDIKCITFITTDQSLFYGISCFGNDIFAEIEEKLYKEYPEYRETNNTFLANGREVLRFKTINENKIGTGKPIMLIKPS